jgi:hypothetical protein
VDAVTVAEVLVEVFSRLGIPEEILTDQGSNFMSTGFSPFELLYGRNVRGPLDLLKEQWTARKTTPDSMVSFVLKIRERLDQTKDLANSREAVIKHILSNGMTEMPEQENSQKETAYSFYYQQVQINVLPSGKDPNWLQEKYLLFPMKSI